MWARETRSQEEDPGMEACGMEHGRNAQYLWQLFFMAEQTHLQSKAR